MTINGQGTFSAVAALAALLIGVFSLDKGAINIPFCIIQGPIYLILVGVLLLLFAANIDSRRYNERIKKLEDIMKYLFEGKAKDQKEIDDLHTDIFTIRPNVRGNYLVFFGVLAIVIGTFVVICLILNNQASAINPIHR